MAKFQFTLRSLFLFTTLFAVALCVLVPAAREAGNASKKATCDSHMKQLLLAAHLYHDVYGSFPPAYVADSHGKPQHSWRVLLLPFLGYNSLYGRYDLNEPWDGPNNRRLAGRMPDVFRCPLDSTKGRTTSYVAVVGDETVWNGAKPMGINDIHDGTQCTVMLVEVADSGIHWMEPRDLSFDDAIRSADDLERRAIRSGHPTRGPALGHADGSVRHLSESDLSPKWLRALLTIAGREPIPGFYYY